MSSAFLKVLADHDAAAIGVVAVRTREPLRAMELLETAASRLRLAWRTWKPGDVGEPGLPQTSPELLCWLHPHHELARRTELAQRLLAAVIPTGKGRVVLVLPPEGKLPPEVAHSIPVLDLPLPDQAERLEEVAELWPGGTSDLAPIAGAGSGLTMLEYERAVGLGIARHGARPEAVAAAVAAHRASSLRTDALEPLEAVPPAQVAGMTGYKAWLDVRARAWRAGGSPPRGCLLVGPPGTGKSLGARMAGAAMGWPVLRLEVGRLFGSLVGQSEQRIRETLAAAEACSPCVLLLDEADKAFDRRATGGDGGTSRRVLGALLTWLAERTTPVMLVATANDPSVLPAELTRRGRLDAVFGVGLPDEEVRAETLRIHLLRRGGDAGLPVMDTNGFSQAELEALVEDAHATALADGVPLRGADLPRHLEGAVPLSRSMPEQLASVQRWTEANARAA